MSSLMYKKLNKTLINDKKVNLTELSKIIKFEFTKTLTDYSDVVKDIKLNFEINQEGCYELNFTATVNRIKSFAIL